MGRNHVNSTDAANLAYRQVAPGDRRLALMRLGGAGAMAIDDRGEAVALSDQARALGIGFEHLWGAYDAADNLGPVALLVPRTGRTAMLFISTPGLRSEVVITANLVRAVFDGCDGRRMRIIQALVSPVEPLEQQALAEAGMGELATLEYMQRSVPRSADPPDWPDDVQLLSYRDELRDQFIAALDASYEQTLDCPGLRGLRPTAEVLAGHQATGTFDPAAWTLLRRDGEPVGVMLLNPVPEQQSLELVYLGLAPSARGRGLARRLMQRALQLAAAARARRIALAVDHANTPATRLYRAAGFYRIARKLAMIKVLEA